VWPVRSHIAFHVLFCIRPVCTSNNRSACLVLAVHAFDEFLFSQVSAAPHFESIPGTATGRKVNISTISLSLCCHPTYPGSAAPGITKTHRILHEILQISEPKSLVF
jgi:hypothetical protein